MKANKRPHIRLNINIIYVVLKYTLLEIELLLEYDKINKSTSKTPVTDIGNDCQYPLDGTYVKKKGMVNIIT